MGYGVDSFIGGIVSLRRIIGKFAGAVEFDLMTAGYRPKLMMRGPDPMDWHELFVLVMGFSKRRECQTFRAIHAEDWEWDLSNVFNSLMLREMQGPGAELLTPEVLASLAKSEEQQAEDVVMESNSNATVTRVTGRRTEVQSADDLIKFKQRQRAKKIAPA